jgi:hypothetical protein
MHRRHLTLFHREVIAQRVAQGILLTVENRGGGPILRPYFPAPVAGAFRSGRTSAHGTWWGSRTESVARAAVAPTV